MKGIALHHIDKRKRGGKTLEPYPSPNRWIRLLDKAAIAAGIMGPVMTIPQIWQIFYFHNATGVSALSWGSFMLLDIPFILYGLAHKNNLIFFTYTFWFAVNLTVAAGAIMYR